MSGEQRIIYLVVTITLAVVIVAVVAAMLVGLFHSEVDNKEIFTILGPGWQTIVGVFCGILGGRALGKSESR